MEKRGFLRIGRITKAHGLKGAVKIHPYGGSAEVFKTDADMVAVGSDGSETMISVKSIHPGHRTCMAALWGVDTREQAETLAGCELFIPRGVLPDLDEGTYYWSDIIGLDVIDSDGRYVGRVESIIATGGNDVYVVKNGDEETLIPALDWVVLSVDTDGGVMNVDLPEGL